MAYPAYPIMKTPSYIKPIPEDRGIMSKMSDGSVVSRAVFTKSRLTFEIGYQAESYAHAEDLLTKYMEDFAGCASIVEFTHSDPNSKFFNQKFNVRFTSPPELDYIPPKYWGVKVTIQEA
jgi:hypothetical protein